MSRYSACSRDRSSQGEQCELSAAGADRVSSGVSQPKQISETRAQLEPGSQKLNPRPSGRVFPELRAPLYRSLTNRGCDTLHQTDGAYFIRRCVLIFVGSSIQKPKFSSAFDEVVSFGVSTMTTFFARACTHKSTTLIDVRLAPTSGAKADISYPPLRAITRCEQSQQNRFLFDHLVGAGEQRRRHFERQRPGSAEINHQLELRWQVNRQVARFFALENATCIDAWDPIGLVGIRSIAHQPPDRGKFTAEVEGSHPMPCRKHDDLRRTIEKNRIDSNRKGIDALLPEGCE